MSSRTRALPISDGLSGAGPAPDNQSQTDHSSYSSSLNSLVCDSSLDNSYELATSSTFIDQQSINEQSISMGIDPINNKEHKVPTSATIIRTGVVCHPDYFKLCVGCKSYLIKKKWLIERAPNSFLAEFARLDHGTRMQSCNAYFADSGEYLFERSPTIFDAIYKYYISGVLHRPLDVCLQEFVDELQWWSVPSACMEKCCIPKLLEEDQANQMVKPDLFEGLRCADVRRKLWVICDGDHTFGAKLFSILSIGLVLVSVAGLVIGSVRDFQVVQPPNAQWNSSGLETEEEREVYEPHAVFGYIETVCIVWFTFEYIFRFLVAPVKRSFLFEALNIVDILAIMPFFVELTLQIAGVSSDDLTNFKFAFFMVRLLRSLRVLRVLKVSRYSVGMRIFALTIKTSISQLAMVVMVFSIGVIFFATMVYFMEKDEPGSQFTSIPTGCWWCIVTMTTVGYGDIVPMTTVGKIVGTMAILSGVLVLALPITIMVDNFVKVAGN